MKQSGSEVTCALWLDVMSHVWCEEHESVIKRTRPHTSSSARCCVQIKWLHRQQNTFTTLRYESLNTRQALADASVWRLWAQIKESWIKDGYFSDRQCSEIQWIIFLSVKRALRCLWMNLNSNVKHMKTRVVLAVLVLLRHTGACYRVAL